MNKVPKISQSYTAPPVRVGDWLNDEIGGLVQVGGWTNGRIPWPRVKKTGKHSLILTGDLIRAVRLESSEAVQYWFGVGVVTVWKWRVALGVERVTDGTRELLRERTGVPEDAAARGRKRAATPESRAKMAATKKGKPAHQNTRAALLKAAKAPKPDGFGERANRWMNEGKNKG